MPENDSRPLRARRYHRALRSRLWATPHCPVPGGPRARSRSGSRSETHGRDVRQLGLPAPPTWPGISEAGFGNADEAGGVFEPRRRERPPRAFDRATSTGRPETSFVRWWRNGKAAGSVWQRIHAVGRAAGHAEAQVVVPVRRPVPVPVRRPARQGVGSRFRATSNHMASRLAENDSRPRRPPSFLAWIVGEEALRTVDTDEVFVGVKSSHSTPPHSRGSAVRSRLRAS